MCSILQTSRSCASSRLDGVGQNRKVGKKKKKEQKGEQAEINLLNQGGQAGVS